MTQHREDHRRKLVELIEIARSYAGLEEIYVGNVERDMNGHVLDSRDRSAEDVAAAMMLEEHRAEVFWV
ncbi:hypothetical protein LTR85_009018 [Meristemomyces frigidus]|nr:hypothetical protein LTR85_009018 [Meristemomyces frigidus]